MTDNDIIKALECCNDNYSCPTDCPLFEDNRDCLLALNKPTLDLINRQKAENNDLFCKLTGVMHSVDKWLSVDELKQDEVVRAITMREKTLQIVEKLHEKIEELEEEKEMLRASKAEAVKECIEKIKSRATKAVMTEHGIPVAGSASYCISEVTLYEIVKEMVGES